MNRKEYEALRLKEKRNQTPDKKIKAGDRFFVVSGPMAGTFAIAKNVVDSYVYARHKITNIEFKCRLDDVEVQ